MKVFLFALLAAVGNGMFAYGQRGSSTSENPFLFMLVALCLCTSLFLLSALVNKAPIDLSYLIVNSRYIIISGVGFFLTFLGFYWMYSEHGALSYVIYAMLSILTTSLFVGVVLFNESFNVYHIVSAISAVIAILLFGYGQYKAVA